MRTFVLLLLMVSLSGCVSSNWSNMDWFSGEAKQATPVDVDQEAIQTLAEQAAKRLSTQYPPGRTTLFLEPPKTIFRQVFEDNLRSQGFPFNSTEGGKGALNLYARLDAIQGNGGQHWYLYVRLSDGFSFGHLYALNNQGKFVPVGALTQTPAYFELVDDGTSEPITTESKEWRIRPGSLKSQMSSWAGKGGYQLVWKSPNDFNMHTDAVFTDTFTGAVKRLFGSMQGAGNALKVTIYRTNKVLEVSEK